MLNDPGETYISNSDDIRLKLPKWNNTLINLSDYTLAETLSDIPDEFKISTFISFNDLDVFSNSNLLSKFDSFNNSDIYTTENVSYPFLDEKDKTVIKKTNVVLTSISSNKWNKILGAMHGSDVAIFVTPNYDETLMLFLKDIKGKFQEVHVLTREHNETYGDYPERIIASTGERISMTYPTFVQVLKGWISSSDYTSFLTNKTIMPLLFPTNAPVPNEQEMDINIVLREEDLIPIGDGSNTDPDILPCTPYYNPRFLPEAIKAYELFLRILGIFYSDNEMFVIDLDLFIDNFIENKIVHSYITRILMFFSMMHLVFHHDSLLGFMFTAANEYSEFIDEKTREVWFNS